MANVDPAFPELIVLLDCAPSTAMLMEGTAREICSNVQKARKEAKLTPKDAIAVYLNVAADAPATKLAEVLDKFQGKMADDLKADVHCAVAATGDAVITKTAAIGKDGAQVEIAIQRV